MRTIKVIRFDKYPPEEPIGVAVVFELPCNDRLDYADILVPMEDCIDPDTQQTKDAEQIVMIAKERLTSTIISKFEAMEAKEPIIGMVIIMEDNNNDNE